MKTPKCLFESPPMDRRDVGIAFIPLWKTSYSIAFIAKFPNWELAGQLIYTETRWWKVSSQSFNQIMG